MDFEDSGIEIDSKVSSDTNNTLKQNHEPIISFSPQRCRFDSGQSTTTSFSLTVADLQLDHAPSDSQNHLTVSSNNTNNPDSISNLQNSSLEKIGAIVVPTSTSIQHANLHQLPPQPFSKQHSSQTQHQYSLFQNHQQNPSLSSSQTIPPGPLAINSLPSSATLNLAQTTSNSFSRPTLLSSTALVDSNSISLMVNGAVLSANNPATTTSSTLDLQKRLEKRIAQASAAAVASSAAASSSLSKSTPSFSLAKTMGNDPMPSDIISSNTSSASSRITNSNAVIASSENNGNQISFSPEKTYSSSGNMQKMPSTSSWESSSCAATMDLLWENKVVSTSTNSEEPSKVIMDSLIGSPKLYHSKAIVSTTPSAGVKFDENDGESNVTPEPALATSTCSEQTTSCTTACDTNGVAIGTFSSCSSTAPSINKSSKNNKPKVNHSLRNNNNAANETMTVDAASSSPVTSSVTPAVITVVNTGFDIRKVSALLPPQRLAIPSKLNPQFQSSHNKTSSKITGSCGINSATATSSLTSTTFISPTTKSNNNNNNTEIATAAFPSSPFGNNGTSTGKNPFSSGANTTTASSSTSAGVAVVQKTSTRRASIPESSCNDSSSGVGGNVSVQPSGNGNIKTGSNSSKLSSEKKPLVQWDSDESEEELSFFPAKRAVINDNLSIDNMSLSGEEEDLHLTPPRPLAKKCPCDPRSWLERNGISMCQHHHGDSTRIASKPCVIS